MLARERWGLIGENEITGEDWFTKYAMNSILGPALGDIRESSPPLSFWSFISYRFGPRRIPVRPSCYPASCTPPGMVYSSTRRCPILWIPRIRGGSGKCKDWLLFPKMNLITFGSLWEMAIDLEN